MLDSNFIKMEFYGVEYFFHDSTLCLTYCLEFKWGGADVPGEAVEGTALADEGSEGDLLDAAGVVGEEAANLLESLLVLGDAEGGEEDDAGGLEVVDVGPGVGVVLGHVVAQLDNPEAGGEAAEHLVGDGGVEVAVVGE